MKLNIFVAEIEIIKTKYFYEFYVRVYIERLIGVLFLLYAFLAYKPITT